MKKYLYMLAILIGCSQPSRQAVEEVGEEKLVKKQRSVALDNGKFFESDGKKMLYGGDSTQHFDITNYDT